MTFGPLGRALRLNCWLKKRHRNRRSHLTISSSEYATLSSSGKPTGQEPTEASDQAFSARNAIFEGARHDAARGRA